MTRRSVSTPTLVSGSTIYEARFRARSPTSSTNQSKDLQLAVWLLDVQTHANGFAGAAIGVRLVRELMERYWDNLYPAAG